MMVNILTFQKQSIPIKIGVTNCYNFSIFLMYSAKACTLSNTLEKRIEAFELWCMSRIAGISGIAKVTNKEVL